MYSAQTMETLQQGSCQFSTVEFRKIQQPKQAATLGEPLLMGSHYFAMVKNHSYGNSCFRQSGRVTHEIKSYVYVCS